MSAHRDFCRPPTRIDLSACLEFLVSAVTGNPERPESTCQRMAVASVSAADHGTVRRKPGRLPD